MSEIKGFAKAVGCGVGLRLLAQSLAKVAPEAVSKSLVYSGSAALSLFATFYNCNFKYEIMEEINQEEEIF